MKKTQKNNIVYKADDLSNWPTHGEKNGLWLCARPLPNMNFKGRLLAAWYVLCGKYDAVEWFNFNEGEE